MNGPREVVLPTAAIAAVGVAIAVVLPMVLDLFLIYQATLYVVLAIFALSLAYIWGYGGILSFGHAAYFGLGGYVYAVAAINFGESNIALLLSIALPGLFAAAVGYFMFYGRLSDVYMGVVTLVVSLILFTFISQTAGDIYQIGTARLGGFNGIPSVPGLNAPGDPAALFMPETVFRIALGLLILCYVIVKLQALTAFGRVTFAVRENETRAELLGYDVRRHKLIVFALGGAMAGMAGGLYAAYQNFVDPNVFSLMMSAQAIIWVIVGGVGTLIGPILACLALQYFTLRLAQSNVLEPNLVLGAVLMAIVLLLPKGLLPTIGHILGRLRARPPAATEAPPTSLPVAKQAGG